MEKVKIIETRNLQKTYFSSEGLPTPALRDISITISKGEFVSIMGPSGSGKSTLLHILGLLDEPTKGDYFLDGKNIKDYDKEAIASLRNEKIGFIFQFFNLLARTSVFDNVILPLLYSKVPEKDWKHRALEAIEAVNLGHRKDYLPSQLSGGEKQRVAIARALVTDPSIIFADEPTGNLDSRNGHNILEILQNLNEKQGRTIILITHESHAAAHAQRKIILKDGLVEIDEKILNQLRPTDVIIK
ncbi:MAG: ABC transporter related protein [Parcubacteria group bacterium Gr01-1014_18]|nr:MAG: ABC transporter related protein [Parcubacteria group bacterium Greene0416_36]TSC81546.1 MAG: ABC transporter related protein [Parcubacteria group bacterium Gr01-1014_18]TSC99643.1 MAG: ABC transporter related protein [Parcubacteria group bacterium Greene1014_20]TSD07094.1 MAG: ABC transporter related protein [Parcubacteria group bacterium Greene0714_2]